MKKPTPPRPDSQHVRRVPADLDADEMRIAVALLIEAWRGAMHEVIALGGAAHASEVKQRIVDGVKNAVPAGRAVGREVKPIGFVVAALDVVTFSEDEDV
ncbi:hypothetical protein [Rhodoplanes roseus]|uniref:Uncharacterized protein n=1 Tax=Rhodoplanes roseus TaxID=29409 RepID=A0A327KVE2_9BRAD|nr:hypothetical protein [Rhodoplanes roseus]RAI42799.1 hypothetical protein CH341_17550 [Rhodoplanes roseus]